MVATNGGTELIGKMFDYYFPPRSKQESSGNYSI